MLKKLIDAKKLGGINCLIWKDGNILFQECYGSKNIETNELISIDTIFRISSMTKPITSVLALMLYEENKFDLNDPISNWFPQFTNMKVVKNEKDELKEAKRQITILDLLTHRAGFTYSEFQHGKLGPRSRLQDRSVVGGSHL